MCQVRRGDQNGRGGCGMQRELGVAAFDGDFVLLIKVLDKTYGFGE